MAVHLAKDEVQAIVRRAVDDLSEIIATFSQSMHSELAEVKKEIADIRVSLDRLTNTTTS